MRYSAIGFLAFSVLLAGCQCGHKGTVSATGEVLWQWNGDAGTLFGAEADVVFPMTDIGSSRELKVTIQNIGSSAFTIKEFVNVSGASTFLSSGDDESAVFNVKWAPDVVVGPSETTDITVTFKPPVTASMPSDEYSATTELRPSGADSSRMYLRGNGLAPDCFVPEQLDFGSMPLLTTHSATLSLRNIGLTPITAKAGAVTGAPAGVFQVTGLSAEGTLGVPAGGAAEAQVLFKPTVEGDFAGLMTVQRTAVCPERTVKFRGRGVNAA